MVGMVVCRQVSAPCRLRLAAPGGRRLPGLRSQVHRRCDACRHSEAHACNRESRCKRRCETRARDNRPDLPLCNCPRYRQPEPRRRFQAQGHSGRSQRRELFPRGCQRTARSACEDGQATMAMRLRALPCGSWPIHSCAHLNSSNPNGRNLTWTMLVGIFRPSA